MRDGALLDQLAESVRGRRNASVTGRPALTRDMLVATLGDLVPPSECTVWLDDRGGDSPPAAALPRGFGVRTSAQPSTLGSPGSLLSRLLAEAARLAAARAVAIELDSETGGGSARRRRRPRLDALGGCADSAIGAFSCRCQRSCRRWGRRIDPLQWLCLRGSSSLYRLPAARANQRSELPAGTGSVHQSGVPRGEGRTPRSDDQG